MRLRRTSSKVRGSPCKSSEAGNAVTRRSTYDGGATARAATGCASAPAARSAASSRRRLLQTSEFFEELLFVGLLSEFVDVDVTDDAVLVDDEERTLGHPFGPQDAVCLGHRAVRIEVAQQRKRDSAERFGPCRIGVTGIGRDAHHSRAVLREPVKFGFVRRNLVAAHRRKGERIEREDDGVSALLREFEIFAR